MRVGTLCYATDTGLGILAKSFYDHGVVTDVLVIDHAHHETHSLWYPGAEHVPVRGMHKPSAKNAVRDFCLKMDAMLFFETPFDWLLIPFCKANKVKTVICPMHECTPAALPAVPDLFICPSLLDLHCFKDYNSVFITVPVSVEWRQRDRANVFVHNAGHIGLKGRNGTGDLIDAMAHVKSPIRLILRAQSKLPWDVRDERVDLRIGSVPYSELWQEGDVFVFPERFNGLSLPLQEARAAGMMVMAGDRFPMNSWLPKEPLIPLSGSRKNKIGPAYREFDEAVYDPRDIAAKIDEFYGQDIAAYSRAGQAWAEENSWDRLKPKYLEALCSL